MGEPMPYRLEVIEIGEDEDGDMQTTCVVVAVDSDVVPKRQKRGKLGDRGQILLRCIEQLMDDGKGILLPTDAKNTQAWGKLVGQYLINVSDLRELFCKRLVDGPDMPDNKPDSLSKAFRRTLESAQALENITVYGEFVWFSN